MKTKTDAADDDDGARFPFARPRGEGAGEEGGGHRPAETHRPASPEAEVALLRALKEALSDLPHGEESALDRVRRVAPELVDDDHLLIFLRGEGFDVEVDCLSVRARCVMLLHSL